jgi:hypothetical protein
MIIGRGIFAEHGTMDLQRAHAFLANQHEVGDPKPELKRFLGVLENRPADYAKPIVVAVFTEPVEGTAIQRVNLFLVPALWTSHAIRPTGITQIIPASFFGREPVVKGISRFHASEYDRIND